MKTDSRAVVMRCEMLDFTEHESARESGFGGEGGTCIYLPAPCYPANAFPFTVHLQNTPFLGTMSMPWNHGRRDWQDPGSPIWRIHKSSARDMWLPQKTTEEHAEGAFPVGLRLA